MYSYMVSRLHPSTICQWNGAGNGIWTHVVPRTTGSRVCSRQGKSSALPLCHPVLRPLQYLGNGFFPASTSLLGKHSSKKILLFLLFPSSFRGRCPSRGGNGGDFSADSLADVRSRISFFQGPLPYSYVVDVAGGCRGKCLRHRCGENGSSWRFTVFPYV